MHKMDMLSSYTCW